MNSFIETKQKNKQNLADYSREKMSINVDPETIFDIQIKRIHEYKRQLMLTFYAIGQYNRLKADPNADVVPSTILVGGKAAQGIYMSYLFITMMYDVTYKIYYDTIT